MAAGPGNRIEIGFASASLARRKGNELEPRVLVEGDEKLLPGDASGADDRNAAARVSTHLLLLLEPGSVELRPGKLKVDTRR
jgi:hypothetical protein